MGRRPWGGAGVRDPRRGGVTSRILCKLSPASAHTAPTPLYGDSPSNSLASENVPWTVAQGRILEFLLQRGWG